MKSPQLKWISENDPPDSFPAVEQAFEVPNGLLAAGGDLSSARLLYAYRHGIFPWYEAGQPILWWSPDPRCVLRPRRFHLSRRLKRYLRNGNFQVSFNARFADVIDACAARRAHQDGTWITAEMKAAYTGLHRQGFAHSIEVWSGEQLAGGIYGLSIGGVFFGESMFSSTSNGSKAAMFALCRILADAGSELFDCQVSSPHLARLGAELMPRSEFLRLLKHECEKSCGPVKWPSDRLDIAAFELA